MERANGKLGWRAELLLGKARGLHPNATWSLILREITSSHAEPDADVEVIERDAAAGMLLLGVRGLRFWYPAETGVEVLPQGYDEVFDPRNAHYYEHAGARLQSDDVALDAGACEGYFIHYALQRGARVLAVEPWSRMTACLERTFAAAVSEGRVQVLRALLGKETSDCRL